MLTGCIFTSKLTFLYSAYARRESRICFHRNSFAQNGTQFVQFPYFACRFSPRLRLIAELSDGAVINFDEQLFCPNLASAAGGGVGGVPADAPDGFSSFLKMKIPPPPYGGPPPFGKGGFIFHAPDGFPLFQKPP